MDVLELLKRALRTCASAIKFGVDAQEPVRKELTDDLQHICLNCERAYETVLSRLGPIKDAFQDPDKLAKELRAIAGDATTRNAFKPEHLCGEVDHLLVRLESNLDPLKYAVDLRKVQELRQNLGMVGNYDAAIYASYDEFAHQLDALATQINDAGSDKNERSTYARHVIADFESELRSAFDSVRKIKEEILKGI